MVYSFVVCTFLQVIVISFRPLAEVFNVVPLSVLQWGIVFALAFVPIVIVELQKLVSHKF